MQQQQQQQPVLQLADKTGCIAAVTPMACPNGDSGLVMDIMDSQGVLHYVAVLSAECMIRWGQDYCGELTPRKVQVLMWE
jgi:hypothetical protein